MVEKNKTTTLELEIRAVIRKLADMEHEVGRAKQDSENDLRKLFLDIIRVCDSFERLFDFYDARKDTLPMETKKFINNTKAIYRLLQKVLKDRKVLEIKTESPFFDPHWHEAVETVADPSREDGTILEEVNKGYVWKNYVLRETKVKIVKND